MKKYAFVMVGAVVAIAAVILIQSRSSREATPALTGSTSPHAHGDAGMAMAHTGKVIETMNAGGYTYVLVDTGKEKMWAAAPETEIAEGTTVSFEEGMEMKDFHSDKLDRTFASILFVPALHTGDATKMPAGHPPVVPPKDLPDMDYSGIEAPDGGHRVAELYEGKKDFVGKEVIVRGRVVKFTPGVMEKNWIHLRDGSGTETTGDVTVTTSATAAVGDLVVVRGVLGADKDFGFGYEYEILIEDAAVTVEEGSPEGRL